MFKSWPKIPRLENEIYHITEKIDGTNACVIIKQAPLQELGTYIKQVENFYIFAQSRTRLLTLEDDNFGFAKWVKDHAEQLITDLGEGYHYGEWWGQGINRGYELDHKRFSLFNPNKYSDVCFNVPLIASLTEEDYRDTYWKEQFIDEFKEFGSIAAEGYMKPEGLIIYAEKAKTYWKVIFDK